jgi:hypothetical protein
VGHFAAAETERDFDFHVLAKEINGVGELYAKVMRIDVGAELDFLYAIGVLVFFGFLVLFGLLVAEFAVIYQAANGRIGGGSNFDQVDLPLPGQRERFVERHDPELLLVIPNDTNLAGANLVINAGEVSWRKMSRRIRAAQDTLAG